MEGLRTQMEEIVRYANELNDRINQGIQEIVRCREAIGVYEQESEVVKNREKKLEEQIMLLEPLIQEN